MTWDFLRDCLDQMIDLRHPLAVLAVRMPWGGIGADLTRVFKRKDRDDRVITGDDLFGPTLHVTGGGVIGAGRQRLSIRQMSSLLYLNHTFKLRDEDLLANWAEVVVWQYFSGQSYYERNLYCDATRVARFRSAIGVAGVEGLLNAMIDPAVTSKAIRPSEFEGVIVDSTVHQKAIAYPVDSRLLDIARAMLVLLAKLASVELKQIVGKEGKTLRRKACGHSLTAAQLVRFQGLTERAEWIRTPQRMDKNRLYALHPPEVECISKGKFRKPYEFGVKASIAIAQMCGLVVGPRAYPGKQYDGHVLSGQLERPCLLMEDAGKVPQQVVIDLGSCGFYDLNPRFEIIQRGKFASLTRPQRRWLRRRQAADAIGHLKSDNGMGRCPLAGPNGRRGARHSLRCGLQPAAADARNDAAGTETRSCACVCWSGARAYGGERLEYARGA